jgi:hypothetical protein
MDELRTKRHGKAAGPDMITYEHLQVPVEGLIPAVTALLNQCFREGSMPEEWRISHIKALYKGKGDRQNPNSYRGIALLSVLLKLYTSLLNKRTMSAFGDMLPGNQFGFRPNLSTAHATDFVLQEAKAQLQEAGGKLITLFVDFSKAFDSLHRARAISLMDGKFGMRGRLLQAAVCLMEPNKIRVDDGLQCTEQILQNKGVLQGDSYSPTIFLLYTADLSEKLSQEAPGTKAVFFADDTAMCSSQPEAMCRALTVLSEWSAESRLTVNTEKTKIMVFRRGGRIPQSWKFQYDGKELEIVNQYNYLGVTLQPTLTFTAHLERVRQKAACAIGLIPSLQACSMQTAIKIYRMKVQPSLTYNLATFSRLLTATHLSSVDRIKAMFLKRCMSLHSNVSNTFTYMMAKEPTEVEQLAERFAFDPLAMTKYRERLSARRQELLAIMQPLGPAFTSDKWMQAQSKYRSIVTRCSAHGFHHYLCTTPHCYIANDGCICRICSAPMDRMHILQCTRNGLSLCEFVASCQ